MPAENRVRLVIEAEGRVALDTLDRLRGGLDTAERSAARASTSHRALGRDMGDLSIRAKDLALALAGVGAGLTLRGALDEFKGFESALTDMGKVSERSLADIRKQVMAMPAELGAPTQLVQGLYQVYSAGVTEAAEANDLLVTASKASKAAHVGQADTITALTKLMAGYGGEIQSAAEAADLLFMIEKDGQTSFAQLVPVIGEVAAVSHLVTVSQDEMGASLARITQTAGSTAQAATQYRAIIMGLYKPTEEMAKALKALGYGSGQDLVSELGFAGALQAISGYADKAGISLGKLFESTEALTGFAALAGDKWVAYGRYLEDMRSKAGAADKAFQEWRVTFAAVEETFKATVGKFAVEFGQRLAPKVTEGLEGVSDWLYAHQDDMLAFFGNVADTGERMGKTLVPVLGDVAKLLGDISRALEGLPPGIAEALLLGGGTFALTRNPWLSGGAAAFGGFMGLDRWQKEQTRQNLIRSGVFKPQGWATDPTQPSNDNLTPVGNLNRAAGLGGSAVSRVSGGKEGQGDGAGSRKPITDLPDAHWLTGEELLRRSSREKADKWAQRRGLEPEDEQRQFEVAERLAEAERKRFEELSKGADVQRSLTEVTISDWEAIKEAQDRARESFRTWDEGVQDGLDRYAESATDLAGQLDNFANVTMKGVEDALVRSFRSGKMEAGEFLNMLEEMTIRIGVQQAVTGPLSAGMGSLFGSLSSVFSFHGGGMVGDGRSTSRNLPSWLFNFAPRLHTGLAPDEFPAVLQYGEEVVSRGEVARRKQAASLPPQISVNISTEPGTTARVESNDTYFDGERWFASMMIRVLADNRDGVRDFLAGGAR